MRYLISGGGTGGHIYPALAIAAALAVRDPQAESLYMGNAGKMEADLVPRAGLPFVTVKSAPLTGSPVRKAVNLLATAQGTLQALAHVRRFKPQVVIATGGYVTGPVMGAAKLAGVPLVVWEGNAYPGLTVRLGARWAKLVVAPFPETIKRLQTQARSLVLPVPVRPEFFAADTVKARKSLGIAPHEQVVLATGGSGGGEHFNRLVVGAATAVLATPGRVLLHVTGQRYYAKVKQAYQAAGLLDDQARAGRLRLFEYVHNMPEVMAAADLAIGRAGASFTGEVIARKLPMILIPSPNVTDNHQEFNARAFAERGAGVMLVESGLTSERLAATVQELLETPQRLQEMSRALATLANPLAEQELAEQITLLAKGGTR